MGVRIMVDGEPVEVPQYNEKGEKVNRTEAEVAKFLGKKSSSKSSKKEG